MSDMITQDDSRRAEYASDQAAIARRLCEAIDRAMELGLWEHADRIAASAMRLAPVHAKLTEQLARLRLAQGRFDAALALIDGCSTRTASLRLLHAVCLIHLGRKAEAHLELNAWMKQSSAPLAGRVLLALLEWDLGDTDAATASLLRNLRHFEDPRTLAVLALLSASANRADHAQHWADRLRQSCILGAAPELELMLHSIGVAPAPTSLEPHETHVANLALELIAHEEVIPALVEAQRRSTNPRATELLCAATERALPELADQRAGHEALAALSILLDNRAAANQWAQRGLRINPLSASLSRYLLQPNDATTAPHSPAATSGVLATIGARVNFVTDGPSWEKAA
jgi:hypothetical protein